MYKDAVTSSQNRDVISCALEKENIAVFVLKPRKRLFEGAVSDLLQVVIFLSNLPQLSIGNPILPAFVSDGLSYRTSIMYLLLI